MAEAAKTPKKKNKARSYENDIYTALMGLSLLVVIATIIYTCIRSNDLFGSIF